LFLALWAAGFLLSFQEGPLYSSHPESVYAAAPCFLEDAEHQADPDPPPYLVPAGSPGHSPEAVLQAAVTGTAKVPIKWGEFGIQIQVVSLAITQNCHCRQCRELYKRCRLSRL